MGKQWDAWRAQQRAAMAVQLEAEDASLARIEAAKAANGDANNNPSAHGGANGVDSDPAWDGPGFTKVGQRRVRRARARRSGGAGGPSARLN